MNRLYLIIFTFILVNPFALMANDIQLKKVSATSASTESTQSTLSDDQVLDWSNQALESIFSLDVDRIKNMHDEDKQYLSDLAYSQFIQFMNQAHNLEAINRNNFTSTGKATGQSVILNKGQQENKPMWQVQAQLKVTYSQNNIDAIYQDYKIDIKIVSTPSAENSNALLIDNFSAVQIMP